MTAKELVVCLIYTHSSRGPVTTSSGMKPGALGSRRHAYASLQKRFLGGPARDRTCVPSRPVQTWLHTSTMQPSLLQFLLPLATAVTIHRTYFNSCMVRRNAVLNVLMCSEQLWSHSGVLQCKALSWSCLPDCRCDVQHGALLIQLITKLSSDCKSTTSQTLKSTCNLQHLHFDHGCCNSYIGYRGPVL